jgi:hypothetical protein
MKRGWTTAALLAVASGGHACTETEAFGFKLGDPVPHTAAAKQYSGGYVKNAMGFFEGEVPQPLEGFKHAYGANRDRSFVYAIEAVRPVIDLHAPDYDARFEAARDALIAQVIALKDSLAEKWGLSFEKDYESGLSWTANQGKLSVTVHLLLGDLRVECANTELMGKAFGAAMKGL